MIEHYLNQAITQSDELRLARYFNDACRKSKWIADNYLVEYLSHETKDAIWFYESSKYKNPKKIDYSVTYDEGRSFKAESDSATSYVNSWHIVSGRV